MAMMASTTNNSISVNPGRVRELLMTEAPDVTSRAKGERYATSTYGIVTSAGQDHLERILRRQPGRAVPGRNIQTEQALQTPGVTEAERPPRRPWCRRPG